MGTMTEQRKRARLRTVCQNPACGIEFGTFQAYLNAGRDKYCSRACYTACRTHVNRCQPRDIARVKTLKKHEASWLAALVDGEGSIALTKDGYVRLMIINTSLPLIEKTVDLTGVGYIHRRTLARKHWKQSYVWHVNGLTAVSLLRQMLPFLIVKADRAVAALSLPAYANWEG